MEIHYETNGAFMEEGQLLKPENIAKIEQIPCMCRKLSFSKRYADDLLQAAWFQGRYDIVCPPKTAWDLHNALPDSKLYMIPDAGHSAKVR